MSQTELLLQELQNMFVPFSARVDFPAVSHAADIGEAAPIAGDRTVHAILCQGRNMREQRFPREVRNG